MTKTLKIKNPLEQILDEQNAENVILYDADNKPIEFEQIALIPLEETDKLYAIMLPVTTMQGVNEGEAVLFEIDEVKGSIDVVNDEDIIDKVYTIYAELLKENKKK